MNKKFLEFLKSDAAKLFFSTCLALYAELVFIRWISSEIRIFAFLKNIPLIISFLGLGLGIMLNEKKISVKPVLPYAISFFAVILALAPFTGISDLQIPTGGNDIWVWGASESYFGEFLRSSPANTIFAYAAYGSVVIFFVALIFTVFFGIGEIIGERLKKFRFLKAYSIDLLGSITGVALFTAASFFQLSPFWWLLVLYLLLFSQVPATRLFLFSALAALVLTAAGTSVAYWSPYYRIEIADVDAGKPAEIGYISLNVNHAYHQHMADYSAASLQSHPGAARLLTAFDYDLPYKFINKPGNVLVVGAGAGNDVAAAVRNGADTVTAVEIDPKIIDLGKQYHPEAPYSNPKVIAVVDDARSFFEKNDNKYDTIVYGLLDSHTSVSAYSNIRLDNYVYTIESFREAKNHLSESGSLILTFAAGEPWILARLSSMLTDVFGAEPLVFKRANGGNGGIFMAGSRLDLKPLEDEAVKGLAIQVPKIGGLKTPSDDWPYLYLRSPSIPPLYLGTLVLVVLVFLAAIGLFAGKSIFFPILGRKSEYWHFFFLGAAFLLIETKSVNQFSLLFGSTWVVNSAVILGILIMAFLANAVVARGVKIPFIVIAIGLFAALVCNYYVKVGAFSGEPFFVKFALAGLFIALPIFFSGLLFSSSFERTENVPFAFGANLFGAFFGGMAENAAMIVGINALTFVAMFFYALAVLARPKADLLFDK